MSPEANKLAQEAEPATAPKKTKLPVYEIPRSGPVVSSGDRLSFETFPLEVLPEPLRVYCAESAASLGADPTWIAVPMLSALAAGIGNSYAIKLKADRIQPAAIWTALVGSSGCGKSPALKSAVGPILDKQRPLLLAHQLEMKQWMASRDGSSAPPAPMRFATDDATIESLVSLMQESQRGLILVRDELAGLFDFGRYASSGDGGATVAKFLEIWNGGQVLVDRKVSGVQFVARASLSIAGGIQPKTLARVLKASFHDNGLASRWLFTCPTEREPDWYDEVVSEKSAWAYREVLDRLYCLPCNPGPNGVPTPEYLVVDANSPAKDALAQFVREHGRLKADLDEDQAAAWQKLEDYAGRFALVLQLAEWAANGKDQDPPTVADLKSVQGGITLARWFGNESKRIFRLLRGSTEDKVQDALLQFVKKRWGDKENPGPTTLADVRRSGPRSLRSKECPDKEVARKWLLHLAESGAIVRVGDSESWRPKP